MKKDKKKNPNDYPLFAFRVTDTEKGRLNESIEKLVGKLNKGRSKDEKVLRKNDIIVEALRIGLKALEKRKG